MTLSKFSRTACKMTSKSKFCDVPLYRKYKYNDCRTMGSNGRLQLCLHREHCVNSGMRHRSDCNLYKSLLLVLLLL